MLYFLLVNFPTGLASSLNTSTDEGRKNESEICVAEEIEIEESGNGGGEVSASEKKSGAYKESESDFVNVKIFAEEDHDIRLCIDLYNHLTR